MSQKVIFTYFNENIENKRLEKFFDLSTLDEKKPILLDIYVKLKIKRETLPEPFNTDFGLYILLNETENGILKNPIFLFSDKFLSDELSNELNTFNYKEKVFKFQNLFLKKNTIKKYLSFFINKEPCYDPNDIIKNFGISIIGLGYEQKFLQTQQIQIEQEEPQLFVSNNEPEDPNINDIWIQV